jgi:predicted nucleic acid-binding protein
MRAMASGGRSSVALAVGREKNSMSADKVFVDTNVLTYLFDDAEPEKQKLAGERLRTEQRERELVVSTQVLQELYASLTTGSHPIATAVVAEKAVQHAAGLTVVQVDVPLVLQAITRSREHSLSFWDALIVGAALAAECNVLLSEDLNDGQLFGKLRVTNPFT